jgi:hypothetical protein
LSFAFQLDFAFLWQMSDPCHMFLAPVVSVSLDFLGLWLSFLWRFPFPGILVDCLLSFLESSRLTTSAIVILLAFAGFLVLDGLG